MNFQFAPAKENLFFATVIHKNVFLRPDELVFYDSARKLEPARFLRLELLLAAGTRGETREDHMTEIASLAWQPMAKAPKDSTRILVTIRSTEQGPAEVDVVRWSKPRRAGNFCWMSTDSSHDCPIVYEDWEVSSWMPLPSWVPNVKTPGLAAQLPAAPDFAEFDGSGI